MKTMKRGVAKNKWQKKAIKISFSIILCTITMSLSLGQSNLNFGLTVPQDSSTLPKSKVKIEKKIRKSKEKSGTILQPVQQNEWIISNGWEMAEESKIISANETLFNPDLNTSDWYNATVPGTVLTTLVNQNVYPDPYFGLNNLAIPDSLCRQNWWYRISFEPPQKTEGKTIWLLFNGINYRADIWLNGKQIGNIQGAFTRGIFDVTGLLSDKENILAVHIFPPANPGIPHEESPSAGQGPNGGQLCLDGPTFISSEGWDWVPGIRDRNIGIWQDVRLRLTGNVTLDDPQVITDLPLPDTTVANLLVRTGLVNSSNTPQRVVVKGQIENIQFSQVVELGAKENKTIVFSPDQFSQLKIKNPRLWWPNGYGRPELYKLKLTVVSNDSLESDIKNLRFGIREMSYELTVDAPNHDGWRVEYNPTFALKEGKSLFDNIHRREIDNTCIPKLKEGINPDLLTEVSDKATAPYLVIKVNGKRIFCKGGNWGMDDAMKQVSRAHLEPYFRLHRDAHFNMVRNWTGESTEELFYDLCDEYGLLVWNDFWLSTEWYNLNVIDNNLFLNNARDVVRRFRNHPCIAIWCSRNEGYAPEAIENGLAELIAKEDGTRYYQPNSRYMNLRPSGPWHYFQNAEDYYKNVAFGFNTELGTPSIPTAETITKMMAKEDTWPISDVWYYHDFHYGQKDFCTALENRYGKANSLDDFCKKAQMINYDSHRAMFESWNSKLWNNTTGLLLWMTHPAWPSTVWQVYSWDYETFGSYFASKKACEPVHVQILPDNNKIVAINTTLGTIENALVSVDLFDVNGNRLYQKNERVDILSNQLTYCFTPEFPKDLPSPYMVRLKIVNQKKEEISINEYWETNSSNGFQYFNELNKIKITGKVLKQQKGENNTITFQLENSSKIIGVGIKLNLRDKETNDILLPAYFSDGYFNLLPGERREFTVDYPVFPGKGIIITIDGYNVVKTIVSEVK